MTATTPDRAHALFEPLEARVLLAFDGVHAVAVEFMPGEGLRFGSATAEAQGIAETSILFDDALSFTFDDGSTDDSIRGISFLGS